MKTVMYCGTLFDGTTGQTAKNQVIVIEENKITEILEKSQYQPEADDKIIDCSDQFVMPGLIDMHVHLAFCGKAALTELTEPPELVALKALNNAQEDLMGGFTTVRDAGFSSLRGAQAVRDAISSGIVWGPRVFTSGMYITQTGGHLATTYSQESFGQQIFKPVNTADSPDEVRTACRMMLKYGADQLKLMVTGGVLSNSGGVGEQNMSYEEIVAAVEVGKMHNRVVSCHAHGTSGILAAAKAGVTSIEHCTMVDDEGIEYMLKNNVAAVPTLIVLHVLADGLSKGVVQSAVDKAAYLLPKHADNIRNAYERGVRCVFGTDTGTPLGPHGYQHKEFVYMAEAGISSEDILLAATRYAAELLKWEDQIGTIQPGKFADIIAVKGNPLEDISSLNRDTISFIMKDGIVYKNEQN